MRILMFAGMLLVVGCAPMTETTDYTWYKRFDPSMENRQRDIDLAQCTRGAGTDDTFAENDIDDGLAGQVRVSLVDSCMMRLGWAKVRAS